MAEASVQLIAWFVVALSATSLLVAVLFRPVLAFDEPPSGNIDAPWCLVVGQQLYNAAQVGQLFLAASLCLDRGTRARKPIDTPAEDEETQEDSGQADGSRRLPQCFNRVVLLVTLLMLPTSVYAVSPGGQAFHALCLLTSARVLRGRPLRVCVDVADAAVGGDAQALGASRSRRWAVSFRVEALALICNSLSCVYNFQSALFPQWEVVWSSLEAWFGIPSDSRRLTTPLFMLGLFDDATPPYVPNGDPSNGVATVIFVLVWSVAPSFYALYFLVLSKAGGVSPGSRAQRALCGLCVVHFLFLTDLMDYRYGRGLTCSVSGVAHWVERFAWRLAVLLPVVQKVATRQWLDTKSGGIMGPALHYGGALWALAFFTRDVIIMMPLRMLNLPPSALQSVTYSESAMSILQHYSQALSYLAALRVSVALNALLLLVSDGKVVTVSAVDAGGDPCRVTAVAVTGRACLARFRFLRGLTLAR